MKHLCSIAATVGLVSLHLADAAHAVEEPAHMRGRPSLELASGRKVRAHRDVDWFKTPGHAQRAWAKLEAELGTGITAGWDRATGVPSRIFAGGFPVAGSVGSATTARQFAEAFLARHIDLLAPGARPSDFVLVANDLDASIRTVAFAQRHRGMEVVGGQVSFRFKNDRLMMVGSEARPHIVTRGAIAPISTKKAKARAERWVLADFGGRAAAGAIEGPFVLSLFASDAVMEHRTVVRVVVEAESPVGRYWVYLDANDLTPVAREQKLFFATGTVRYNAPERRPGATRIDYPALYADQTVNGDEVTSQEDGTIEIADGVASSVVAHLTGPLVDVRSAEGDEATDAFSLEPGGMHVWNASDEDTVDAQLNAFVHVHRAKAYAKTFAPTMTWLDQQSRATVNIDDVCNAYSDGVNVNFFLAGQGCENTGRLPDVVYHEFGHSVHYHAIIPGTGQFEGALSEGVSDYFAATITNDASMGRGFFFDERPLRELDPPDHEWHWPEDTGEAHDQGRIIGGALWDLRKALVAKLGQNAGAAKADELYYQGIRRAVDIPTMYPEVLAADDDDGDLSNGTPNACEIAAAFAAHGLRPLSAELPKFGLEKPARKGYDVSLRFSGLFEQCKSDSVAKATLHFATGDEKGTALPMSFAKDRYEATIPTPEDDTVVRYQVEVAFADGSKRLFPDNEADPMYQFYVGDVHPFYCTDFQNDPFLEGWTHGLSKGASTEGADDWQWGMPHGTSGSGDPNWSDSDGSVIGNDLGGGNYNGAYQADKVNFATSPVIDVRGYETVRLQYRRWLNVEDAHFDRASIYANEKLAWRNLDSQSGEDSDVQHQDKEWRFHDVELTPFVEQGKVQLKYEIASDGGLEMGGWTIDDFCVVGVKKASFSLACGDGLVEKSEACDDGDANSDTEPDACRTDCQPAHCGDGVVDTGEACDGGEGCDETCHLTDAAGAGCGCRVPTGEGSGSGGIALAALALAIAARRRRR